MDSYTHKESKSWLGKRLGNKDSQLGLGLFLFSLCLIFILIPLEVKDPKVPGTFIKPDFFPYLITLALTLLSILLIFFGYKTSSDASRSDDKRITKGTVICIITLALSIGAIKWVGMLPVGIMVVFILMHLFGLKNKILAVVVSFGFNIAIFLFFDKVASISIPRGTIFEKLF